MYTSDFRKELDRRIAQYDLLCHPFYQAWASGRLTREDLRCYAEQYFHQVAAFPEYLKLFEDRLPAPARELALAVARNRAEEEGDASPDGRSHAELWLDFAEGMGADRAAGRAEPLPELQDLLKTFRKIAREGLAAEALAAFYAYESQVPRIAKEKARGLKELYGADAETCAYFTVHQTADVHHARVWSDQLQQQLRVSGDESKEKALEAAERVAQALWRALDGIERERLARAA